MFPLVALAIGLVGGIIQLIDAPWWITVATGVPCLVLLPGWAVSRAVWPRSSMVQSIVDAVWTGILIGAVGIALLRLTGLGQGVLWATGAAVIGLVSFKGSRPPRLEVPSPKILFGLSVLLVTVASLAVSHSPTLSRGLDVGWYHADLQDQLQEQVTLDAGEGWGSSSWISSPDEGALVLADDGEPGGTLVVQSAGAVGVLVRGPLGSSVSVRQGDTIR